MADQEQRRSFIQVSYIRNLVLAEERTVPLDNTVGYSPPINFSTSL